jgi:tetratricopeptide (TPR) repeat protein
MSGFHADQLTYLAESLRLQMEQDPEAGFYQWAQLLDQAMEASNYSAVQSLLTIMKQILAGDGRTPSPTSQFLIRTTEGSMWAHLGEWQEALTSYQRALESARDTGDPGDQAWVLSDMGNVYYVTGRYELALSHFQEALTAFRQSENLSEQARVLANLGSIYRDMGQMERAQICSTEALQCQQNQLDVQAVAYTNLGSVLQIQKDWTEAEKTYQKALHLFEKLNNIHGQAKVLGSLGLLHLDCGRIRQAIDLFIWDLDLHQQVGDDFGQAQTLNNLAIAYRRIGRLDEALTCYKNSLFLRRQLEDWRGELITLINMSILYQEQDELNAALDCLSQGRLLAQEKEDVEHLREIEQRIAQLSLHQS